METTQNSGAAQNAPHAQVRAPDLIGGEPRSAHRLAWAAYGLAALVVILDQLSKWWVVQVIDLSARGPITVLPFFHLSMVQNPGVSYGLLKSDGGLGRWLLAAFSVVVAVALAVWARRVSRPLTAAAIGLIMGGAVGNVIDRIRLGLVTDFLDFGGLGFPWVFNLADSAITIGVILLLLENLFAPKRP